MKDEHFDAILDKNNIARTLKAWKKELQEIDFPIDSVLWRLGAIESFIGQANQPTVESIFNSKYDI